MASSQTSEFSKMQKELMSAISESSARLAEAWMNALTRAGALVAPDDRWLFGNAFSSTPLSRSLSKMIEAAAVDLPELMRRETDRRGVRRVKQRWLEYYEDLVCEAFGIPSKSQAQRVVDQWRDILKSTSHGHFPGISELSLLFSPVTWASAWPFRGWERADTGLFNTWVEAYRRGLEQLFLPQKQAIPWDYEKKVRRAFDAQVKFFDFLPEFHEQLMTAARRGLESVVKSIGLTGATEITPEVYHDFFKIWIANHEKEFTALFVSKPFMAALTEVVRLAGTVRERMDSLAMTGASMWDVPSRKELDVIREAVDSLRKEVGDLRRQVDHLRRLLEQQVQKTERESEE